MHRPFRLALLLVACLLAGACEADQNPANPTPASFEGIVQAMTGQGVLVSGVTSGDPGCSDQSLARTAISFVASGLDQVEPTRVYLYIFRDRGAFERLLSAVDQCARTYATDPATFASVDVSPYVAAGAGPWAATFADHLRAALTRAAGNGG